jgi:glycosyltransferase involved in cell wall biosynthesis
MRQLLIVAYYFPPLGGIGSLRIVRLASHLAEHDWRVTVLAPANGAYTRDPTLTFPEKQVVRSRALELSRAAKRVLRTGGDDVQAAQVAGLKLQLRRLAHDWLYFPDPQIGWYPPALLSAQQSLQHKRFDAIYSSSFPITAHLIARTLHRRWRIPWVAEFRDPWSDMLPAGTVQRRRAIRLERQIGRACDAAVTVSPSWAAMYERRWQRPVTVLRNAHDGQLVASSAGRERDDELVLGYLGSYYPQTQSLQPLWTELAQMRAQGETKLPRIKVIGNLDPAFAAQADAAGLTDRVTATGTLPHEQAAAELLSCSALLIAGPTDASGLMRGQIAAKLYEYLATDLPIIYIGDPGADAARLLAAFPATAIVPTGDQATLRLTLTTPLAPATRNVGALSARSQTQLLARLLDSIAQSEAPAADPAHVR